MSNYYGEYNYQNNYAPNPYSGRGGAQWGRGGYNAHPHPDLEAPRRGRGRRYGGPPRREQPQQQQVPTLAERPAAIAEAPTPSGVPQPKHLSMTSSPLTNDPLYLENFMSELGTEMRMAPVANEVHPGHFGFAQLAEEDYKSVAARSHVYAKNVSESMHSYYNGMHVYGRMLEVRRQCGDTITVDESDFVTQLEVGDYSVTKTVEQYLSGFGNTIIPGSVESSFKFDKPVLQAGENITGFFGPLVVNAVNYEKGIR